LTLEEEGAAKTFRGHLKPGPVPESKTHLRGRKPGSPPGPGRPKGGGKIPRFVQASSLLLGALCELIAEDMRKEGIPIRSSDPFYFAIRTALDESEDKELRLDAFKALAPYLRPKLAMLAMKTEEEQRITIVLSDGLAAL
jgi:hypothetical protein